MSSNVLVFGASGRVCSEVVRQLLRHPNPPTITAAVRDLSKYQAEDAVRVVRADLQDASSIREAVQQSKAERAFLYVVDSNMADAVSALKEAGIKHVVLLSSWMIKPAYLAVNNVIGVRHVAVENTIRSSDLTYTFLRCGAFGSSLFSFWKRGILSGGVCVPYAEATFTMVAEEDIAAAAVHALTSADLNNQVVPVVGPTPLTMQEIMTAAGRVLGRPVTVTAVSEAEWRKSVAFLPPPVADAFLDVFRDRDVEKEGSTPMSAKAVGRPGTTLAKYLEQHKSELTA